MKGLKNFSILLKNGTTIKITPSCENCENKGTKKLRLSSPCFICSQKILNNWRYDEQ